MPGTRRKQKSPTMPATASPCWNTNLAKGSEYDRTTIMGTHATVAVIVLDSQSDTIPLLSLHPACSHLASVAVAIPEREQSRLGQMTVTFVTRLARHKSFAFVEHMQLCKRTAQ